MGWSQDINITANANIISTGEELRGAISLSMAPQSDLAVVLAPCDGVESVAAYASIRIDGEDLQVSDNGASVVLSFTVARSVLNAEKYAVVVTFKDQDDQDKYVVVNWPSPTGLLVP